MSTQQEPRPTDITIPPTEKQPFIRVERTKRGVTVIYMTFDGRTGKPKPLTSIEIPLAISKQVGEQIMEVSATPYSGLFPVEDTK